MSLELVDLSLELAKLTDDNKGNQIEMALYKPKGNLAYKSICKYDGNDNLLENIRYHEDGSVDSKLICKYDKKGFRTEDFDYSGDEESLSKRKENKDVDEDSMYVGLCEHNIYKYDDKGNRTERLTYYGAHGTLSSKYSYKYDNNGKLIEVEVSTDIGAWSEIFKYDDKGNNLERGCYNSNGTLTEKRTYKYDDNGNLIEETQYIKKSIFADKGKSDYTSKSIFKYDDNSNRIEETFYVANDLTSKSICKYDDNGNRVEEAKYNDKGIMTGIITSSYTYYWLDFLKHSSQLHGE